MAIIDEELDELARQREEHKTEQAEATPATPVEIEEGNRPVHNEIVLPPTSVETPIAETPKTLGDRMNEVNTAILAQAAAEDKKFVDTIKENIKEAAVTHTEVEKESAELDKKGVLYEQEKIDLNRQKVANAGQEDKWDNREKRRLYHYNGVKPIMRFIGVDDPLNLFLLYFLTVIAIPFYLLNKGLKASIGVLIAGASDDNRPKAVKGFLWTLLAVIAVLAIAVVTYLFLKWQHIITI